MGGGNCHRVLVYPNKNSLTILKPRFINSFEAALFKKSTSQLFSDKFYFMKKKFLQNSFEKKPLQ
jgi:hypothetical protein